MQDFIFMFLFYFSWDSKTQQMVILLMQTYKFYSIPIKNHYDIFKNEFIQNL